jgi:TolA-binding protein
MDKELFFKISDYLAGELPREEAIAFSKEIADDPELADLVLLQNAQLEGIEAQVEDSLDPNIIKNTEKEISNNRTRPFLFWLIISSVIILLLAIPYLLIFDPSDEALEETSQPIEEKLKEEPPTDIKNLEENTNYEFEVVPDSEFGDPIAGVDTSDDPRTEEYLAIFTEFYTQPERIILKSTNDLPTGDTNLDLGIIAFLEGNYTNAAQLFEHVSDSLNIQYQEAQDWLAHTYIALDKFDEASSIFIELYSRASFRSKDKMEWYLMLSLMPSYQENKDSITRILDRITNEENSHIYLQEGIRIRSRLNAN